MSGPEEPRRPDPPDRGPGSRWIPDPLAAKRSMASAYQGAIEAVAAMALCVVVGWWIDRRFGSEPWGLFLGMGFGFAAMLLRLLRIKSPTIGRPSLEPKDEADEPGWSQALTPNRDPDRDRDDEESGGPPEPK